MKKRNNRTLAFLVSLCMVFALLPTAAFADTGDAAQIGEQGYSTLAEAFQKVQNGETITVLKDTEIDETITLDNGYSVTLDLGGYTVTTASRKFISVRHGSLTIQGNGMLKESEPYFAPVVMYGYTEAEGTVENYSVVTVDEGVTLEGWAGVMMNCLSSAGKPQQSRGMVLNVNGKLNGVNDSSDGEGVGVYLNGQVTAKEGAPKVTVGSTAEITATGLGIYAAGYGEWTVEDGAKITGLTGIELRAGKLTVNGGTITGTGETASCKPSGNGSTTVGAGIAVVQHTTNLDIDVTVKGGTVKGAVALFEDDVQDDDSDNIKLSVTGGSFVGTGEEGKAVEVKDVTRFIKGGSFSNAITEEMDYLSDELGMELKKGSGDARYSYYATLAGAQKDAAPSDTITDLTAETTYTVTIKHTDQDKDDEVYHLAEGAKLTLPKAIVYKGYTFQGWSDADDTYPEGATYTVPNHDAVLTGQWLKDEDDPAPKPSKPVKPAENGVDKLMETEKHVAFLQGDDLGNFRPNADVTRAEAVQMLYNLLKDKAVKTDVSFADVAEDAWYHDAVNVLAELGIVKGVGEQYFAPERTITRAEFVVMAMRFANAVKADNDFSDVDKDHWAYDEISGAVRYGWVTGYTDGTFGPGRNVSRAEAATILCRMLAREADEDYIKEHAKELKLFPDVKEDCWAYYTIVEATNDYDAKG